MSGGVHDAQRGAHVAPDEVGVQSALDRATRATNRFASAPHALQQTRSGTGARTRRSSTRPQAGQAYSKSGMRQLYTRRGYVTRAIAEPGPLPDRGAITARDDQAGVRSTVRPPSCCSCGQQRGQAATEGVQRYADHECREPRAQGRGSREGARKPSATGHAPVTDGVLWRTSQYADIDGDLPFEAPPHAPGLSAGAAPPAAWPAGPGAAVVAPPRALTTRPARVVRVLRQAPRTKLKMVG
jgi:hypothetical protein